MQQSMQVTMAKEKSKKPYRHAGRFDEETEGDFNFIKKYREENYLDTDDSSILRSSVRFYADFLRGKIGKKKE